MEVSAVQVFSLRVEAQFARLDSRAKRYAHHLARASWLGSRIVLRQVSPEASSIFDFILELHRHCQGNWSSLAGTAISDEALQSILTYAAAFLSNLGNYYGSGDQKFVPCAEQDAWRSLASLSPRLGQLYQAMSDALYTLPPFGLGYPSKSSQSSYYVGDEITDREIHMVSKTLENSAILPENTRIRKIADGDSSHFQVLVASTHHPAASRLASDPSVELVYGDHADDLQRVCDELAEASKYAANETQKEVLDAYIESFQTGSLDAYRESQRRWVRDKGPRVENIFGFVEPYRDPHGTRAEFEALVGIVDDQETRLLRKLSDRSETFIRRLPWAGPENQGKGLFEKSSFDPPDFSSIHVLAYCSSIIFPGINLPNYNDIRQTDGFKNVIVANRMAVESQAGQCLFLDPSEAKQFQEDKYPAYYWWVVCHELFGHGTGKMMTEAGDGTANFDTRNPPINPVTGKPISSWYRPGQTWTGQFGDLATTVDECRAELVGAYLMMDPELLELVGLGVASDQVHDMTYNLFQQLAIDGLRGLANYSVETEKWGQAHSRAHFAMLQCLLRDGDGVIEISHDVSTKTITAQVDRSKISSTGKTAISKMLLQLHMFRCTADAEGCREYYGALSRVEGLQREWRSVVLAKKPPPLVFVQANTSIEDEQVVFKEYEPTVEGVIESWAERLV